MRAFSQLALPLGACGLAGAMGWMADAAARRRRPDGDRGDFWSRVARRTCLVLGPLLLASGSLQDLQPQVWASGWHLLFDRTGAFGWSPGRCYPLALLLPFAVWGVFLALGLIEAPGGREAARWLAGSVVGGSRAWVLFCALPLALVLGANLSRLGGGAAAYPAAVWGTLAVLALSLTGVALSAGPLPGGAAATAAAPASGAAALPPWPQAMAAGGIQLRSMASWPESGTALPVPGPAAALAEQLRLMGASEIAPELIAAIQGLLSPTPGVGAGGLSRLVMAPDDCGEVEAVALAAQLLDQRSHAATLVVTAKGANALAARFRRWTAGAAPVVAIGGWDSHDRGGAGEVAAEAQIWVIDAQSLSDRLLVRLKDTLLARRFGLVVWWHLEDYTGVLAANLWAISRRLHRLLRTAGRHDARTLALVRRAPHGGAQLAAFVRQLLPHSFPSSSEVHVGQRFPRPLHLHLLESHRGLFARDNGIPPRLRQLPLVAAKVSVEAGWPTCLEVPDDVAEIESSAFLQLPAGPAPLGDRLQAGSAESGARVRQIRAGEILSLLEVLGQGGRSAPAGLPHHVGVLPPANPYAAYLLSRLGEGASFGASRRLVSSEAHPALVRRHLVYALSELPATRSSLLKDFLWREEVIRQTLDEIAEEGKLTRREVRFLEGGELRRDHEYTSQRPPSGEQRPLDTVGAQLVDVRDRAGGYDTDGGVRMRVDPERLTIQAYPHRVFLSHGRRYRIREWGSVEQALASGWLACEPEDVYATTWRLRSSQAFRITPRGAPVGIGRTGRLLTRVAVELIYEEWVTGALRLVPDLAGGEAPELETLRLSEPIAQSFGTRGLVLRFPQREEALALASLCEALRHVLPVHLGVEEDAIELVPLAGEEIEGQPTFGLAVVDLYPGGIGLTDAIGEDGSWLLELMGWARDWLARCPCQSEAGCPGCLRSPASLAANSDQPPLRAAALALLRQIV